MRGVNLLLVANILKLFENFFLQANVVCQQLGFPGVKSITKSSKFGLVGGKFSYDNINCTGESNQNSVNDTKPCIVIHFSDHGYQ